MCNFLSAVALPNGEIKWHWALDSHSDIVRYYGLRDDAENLLVQRFAKVELIPDWSDPADEARWKFEIDEPTKPAWWDGVAERVEETMRRILRARILKTGRTDMILDDVWVVCGDAEIGEMRSGRIVRIMSGNIGEVRGGNIGEVRGGNIGEVWGGNIGEVWDGTIGKVVDGTIGKVCGGTVNVSGGIVSKVWGGTVNVSGGTIVRDYRTRASSQATRETSSEKP